MTHQSGFMSMRSIADPPQSVMRNLSFLTLAILLILTMGGTLLA